MIKQMFSLKRARDAALAGRWSSILDEVNADPDLARDARILHLYIMAAHETKSAGALDAAAAMGLSTPWVLRDRFSVSRKLAAAGRPEEAWRILALDPATADDPGFVRQAKRLYGAVKDAEVRRAIRTRLTAATSGGLSEKPEPSNIVFVGLDRPSSTLGAIHASASSQTPSRHHAGFETEMQLMRSRLRSPSPPKAVEYRDVYVDRYGQIWREGGQIIQTNGKPIPAEVVGAKRFDTACHAVLGTRGIYHWLVDQTPRFGIYLDPAAQDTPVLIGAGRPRFEAETLDLMRRSLGVQYETVDDSPVFVHRLLTPRVGFQGLMYPDATGRLFGSIKDAASDLVDGRRYGDRIYISRRDAKRRPMINEALVEQEMVARGFQVLLMGDLPIADQIVAAAGAKVIVAPHGAGLAHVIFAERNSKIIEILPIMDGSYALRFNYARLCMTLGHDYHAWLEPQRGGTDRWMTELPEFLPFLDDALTTG